MTAVNGFILCSVFSVIWHATPFRKLSTQLMSQEGNINGWLLIDIWCWWHIFCCKNILWILCTQWLYTITVVEGGIYRFVMYNLSRALKTQNKRDTIFIYSSFLPPLLIFLFRFSFCFCLLYNIIIASIIMDVFNMIDCMLNIDII